MKVDGLTAVVTGGAGGIGKGIAQALARRRCNIVVADLDLDRAEDAAASLRAGGANTLAAQVDVGERASVEALADTAWQAFGSVELLFNNAGIGILENHLDIDDLDVHWIYSVNFFGVWHGCAVFGKRFMDGGKPAWICNTGSEHSIGAATAYQAVYTSTKHAVLGMSDSLRLTLPEHVGISVLCPAIINTGIWESERRRTEKYARDNIDDSMSRVAKQIVSTRGMDPAEVGERALRGIEDEDFFIFTHPHIRLLSHARDREIAAASDKQVPAAGELKNETAAAIEEVMSELSAAE